MKPHLRGKLVEHGVSPDLRSRLEKTRLDLRALFRALDRDCTSPSTSHPSLTP